MELIYKIVMLMFCGVSIENAKWLNDSETSLLTPIVEIKRSLVKEPVEILISKRVKRNIRQKLFPRDVTVNINVNLKFNITKSLIKTAEDADVKVSTDLPHTYKEHDGNSSKWATYISSDNTLAILLKLESGIHVMEGPFVHKNTSYYIQPDRYSNTTTHVIHTLFNGDNAHNTNDAEEDAYNGEEIETSRNTADSKTDKNNMAFPSQHPRKTNHNSDDTEGPSSDMEAAKHLQGKTIFNNNDSASDTNKMHTSPNLPSKTEHKADGKRYEIELYTVMDYLLYKKWKSVTPPSENTIALMKQYFALIVNEMNFQFRSLSEFNLNLRIIMSGLRILTTEYNTPYVLDDFLHNDTVQFSKLHASFETWARNQSIVADAVQLFTGWKEKGTEFKTTAGTQLKITRGMQSMNGVCDDMYKYGIVHDDSSISVSSIASHELGHGLGMKHDDANTSEVNWKPCLPRRYIMHETKKESPDLWEKTNLKFSRCSAIYLKKFLRKLDEKNCLLRRDTSFLQQNLHYWGVDLTLNQQCERILGKGSTLDLAKTYDLLQHGSRRICRGMYCYEPYSIFSKLVRPYPGTPCADDKVCKHEQCVSDPTMGINVDDECFLGNGSIYVQMAGDIFRTCASAINFDSGSCNFINKLCCRECRAIGTLKDGACRYGDRPNMIKYRTQNGTKYYTTCKELIGNHTSICYNNNLTCPCSCGVVKARVNNSNCLYGDHTIAIELGTERFHSCADFFVKYSKKLYCPQLKEKCCESCINVEKKNIDEIQLLSKRKITHIDETAIITQQNP